MYCKVCLNEVEEFFHCEACGDGGMCEECADECAELDDDACPCVCHRTGAPALVCSDCAANHGPDADLNR